MAVQKRNRKTVGQKLKSAEKSAERAFTVLWEELPLWQQDNHYILSGYRPEFRSFKKCFISLGYLHNETVNIYSHLLPALLLPYAALLIYTLHTPLLPSTLLTLGTFLVAATTCLGMSATYHTISCHSHAVAQAGNRLDYLGIVALIVGSFLPSVFYGFYCDQRLVRWYWTMMLTFALLCALVSTLPTFRTPPWRPFRAAMFVALGGSSAVPVLHGLARYGYENLEERMGLSWMLLEGALYVAGAGIYAARVPEKWAPGRFDIWGSSHQVFHVLVVAAAVAHGVGLVKSVKWLEGRVMTEGVDRVCF